MKNSDPGKGGPRNKMLKVAATMYRPGMTGILIKKIAGQPADASYRKMPMHHGWCAFGSSSAQVYIKGTMLFSSHGNDMHVPFDNAFLFTCIKSIQGHRLQWSMSLS